MLYFYVWVGVNAYVDVCVCVYAVWGVFFCWCWIEVHNCRFVVVSCCFMLIVNCFCGRILVSCLLFNDCCLMLSLLSRACSTWTLLLLIAHSTLNLWQVWRVIYEVRHARFGVWRVPHELWCVARELWCVRCNLWRVTCDVLHATHSDCLFSANLVSWATWDIVREEGGACNLQMRIYIKREAFASVRW